MRRIASALLVCVAAVAPPAGLAQDANQQADNSASSSAAATGQPLTTRLGAFSIPFTSKQARDENVVAVQLLVSADRGANWHLYVTQRPTVERFNFRSAGDGEYWFASRTVTADGVVRPEAVSPELKVIVDTTPPEIEFSAVVDAVGKVTATWKAADMQIAPEHSKLQYRGVGEKEWRDVEFDEPASATSPQSGTAAWRPESNSLLVEVRLQMADRAGNVNFAERRLLVPRVAASPAATAPKKLDQPPTDPFSSRRQAHQGATPWPGDDAGQLDRASAEATKPNGTWRENEITDSESAEPSSPATAGANHTPATTGADDRFGAETETQDTQEIAELAELDKYKSQPSPTHPPVASRVDSDPPAASTDSATANTDSSPVPRHLGRSNIVAADALPLGERPRMINRNRFPLVYDVESVGPTGVARVDLWATRDGGQNWQRWGEDGDRTSPLEVVVGEEGIYGFRVVVTNGDNISGDPPKSGEPADIWLAVDTTKPTARITAAPYGTGDQAGHLDIQWEAGDAHLAQRPITLLYAESPSARWTTIASGLPNTGRYTWQVGPQVPRQIYLRLEVRDEAGNVGIHQLTEPINVSGLRPKARIRGVLPEEPAPRTSRILGMLR